MHANKKLHGEKVGEEVGEEAPVYNQEGKHSSYVTYGFLVLDQTVPIRPLQINFLFPVHCPHPQAGVGVAPLFGF